MTNVHSPSQPAYVIQRGDNAIPVSQAQVDAARILVRRAKLRNRDVDDAVMAIAHAKPPNMNLDVQEAPSYQGQTAKSSHTPRGYAMTVLDRSGDIVGRATHAFLEERTSEPQFMAVVVNPSKPSHLVPLAEAVNVREDQVQVPYDRSTIETAPTPDSDRHLSEDDVRRLHEHYGLRFEVSRPRGRR
jgi:hypothetical protein